MTQIFLSRSRLIPSFLFKMLKSIGFQAVDMHFHTEYSMDAVSSIESILSKCRKRGYGVAVTDHNEIRGAARLWHMKKDVVVIPGMEASTIEGIHSLYYFYDIGLCKKFYNAVIQPLRKKDPFFLPITAGKLLEKAKRYNAVTCAPHPYSVGKTGMMKIKDSSLHHSFDMIEGLNGNQLRKWDQRAVTWAKSTGKGISAGSDGHLTKELGNALTLAYGNDVESFLSSVQKGKNIVLGKEVNVAVNAIRQIVKEKNYFKHARAHGKGWLWLSDHARELTLLEHKLSKNREPFRKHAHSIGLNKKDYEEYVKLRFGKVK